LSEQRAQGDGGVSDVDRLPGVTLGILNKNGLGRLQRCLPSVLALDYPTLEILVVDYGSTDGCIEFLEGFPDIRIVHLNGEFNLPHGRNTLVREARQPFFFMCDNDIEIPDPALLRHLMASHRSRPDIAFISPLLLNVGADWLDDVGISLTRVQRRQPLSRVRGHGLVQAGGHYGNCALFARDLYFELGPSDERYPYHNDDYDLATHAYLRGYRVVIDTDHYVVHHGVSARVNVEPASWRQRYHLCSVSRTIWKYYRAPNVILWWPIVAGWIGFKALRLARNGRSPKPIGAYFLSLATFLRDLPDTLRDRRRVQRARRVARDEFLRIRPAEF
jgi:GT2 family glycosyltransferase